MSITHWSKATCAQDRKLPQPRRCGTRGRPPPDHRNGTAASVSTARALSTAVARKQVCRAHRQVPPVRQARASRCCSLLRENASVLVSARSGTLIGTDQMHVGRAMQECDPARRTHMPVLTRGSRVGQVRASARMVCDTRFVESRSWGSRNTTFSPLVLVWWDAVLRAQRLDCTYRSPWSRVRALLSI